ncbi:MAG: hypothetical protein ACK459_09605 [Akkermansiaceae bacterium]|jgi:hypothetical protein
MIKYIQSLNKPTDLNIDIYGICFKDSQNTEYKRIYNKVCTIAEKSYLFEYNVILNTSIVNEYAGFFSWKFRAKTGMNKRVLFNLLLDNHYWNYEVINLCEPLPKPYLEFSETNHKGFIDLFTSICADLGLKVNEPKHTIYSNFFIAKKDVFIEYQELLKKAIELLETKYKKEAWNDSGYKGLPKERLKEATGLDHYTFHTFILERLMSVWIDNKNIKTLDLI